MYYLLEDNSIHYDGDKKKIQSATYDFGRKEMSINGGKWKKWIKHSENVFDLIEVGDLVKFAWNNRNDNCPISIRKVYSIKKHKDNCWFNVDYELAIYDDEILAIYKPNKNGDYIKVWEKENENE